MSTESLPGAVVVVGYITGLSAVRALACHGIPVAVVTTTTDDITLYSRWVSEYHILSDFHGKPESLLELFEQQSRR